MHTPPYREPTEVFNWADFEEAKPTTGAELAVRPAVHPPMFAPGAPLPEVRYDDRGQPRYAYIPAAAPVPYDPLPQRMYGCGVMAFGILAGAGVAEAGSYWMFAGMAVATHAIIGVAAVFVFGTIGVVALRMSGGVRIGSFHQGDNSTFRVGR